VLVRCLNSTRDAIEFVVTAERQWDIPQGDGTTVRETSTETVNLRTAPQESANEVGALFDCPITRVGLGENLNQPFTDFGLYILESDSPSQLTSTLGFGVPGNINPLDSTTGNFGCGDTIIFRVIESRSQVGNVQVQSLVLPSASQPTEYTGPHTFNNARLFLESTVREED